MKRQPRIQRSVMLFATVLAGPGCVTDAQYLAQNSSAALSAAENRAKFELNCPQVDASILSQKVGGRRLG